MTSGSVGSQATWGRLRVSSERRTFIALPILRLGYPSRYPNSLGCDKRPIPPQPLDDAYRTELIGERSWRGVRVWPAEPSGGAAPWPDTLLIRLFEDSVDEEIALERREIDAAIFWGQGLSRFIGEQFLEGAVLSGKSRLWRIISAPPERVNGSLPEPDSVTAFNEACPIVTTKALRPYLAALGPDSLANLLSCDPMPVPKR